MSHQDWLLGQGIKSILRCDEAEVVSGIAHYIISQRRSLRLVSALTRSTWPISFPGIFALIGGAKSFLELHKGTRSVGAAWIARFDNERNAIKALMPFSPDLDWTELKFQGPPEASTLSLLARNCRPGLRRICKLMRLLHPRYEFFKALRAVELIAYYARFLNIFKNGRFRIAVTSNHSNPHGIAFNLAARKCGVPVVLIAHGMPIKPIARLSYDLSVIHCEATRQAYLDAGCRLGRVFIHGRMQHYRPMPTGILPKRFAIGIFLCKDVNDRRLRVLTDRLLADARVKRILIRPHPINLWAGLDAWIASLKDARVRRSAGGPVSGDLESSDIILAGNSSVLVEAVTAGRPSGYVTALDCGPPDLHEFVARGLIYPINDELEFDPDAMLRFYRRPGWSDALRPFANIDEDETSVLTKVCAAMRQLTADPALSEQ
jgi:hypothetical protein